MPEDVKTAGAAAPAAGTPTPTPTAEPAAASKEPVKTETAAEKPTESKSPEDTKSTAEKTPPVVPEKYELKLSEGSLLDAAYLEKIEAIARQRGLSQEDAQSLLQSTEQELAAQVDRQAQTWLEQTKADPEIGGNNFNESVAVTQRFINAFASPALKEELNRTGRGNHPEFVRFFYKVGKHFQDDKAVFPGTTPDTKPKTLEEKFYPTMFASKE